MKRSHNGMSFKKAQPIKSSSNNKVQPARSKPMRAKSANPRRRGS